MRQSLKIGLALLMGTPGALYAEPPRVVSDIAPVHAIVARVMDGVGVPHQLINAGVSPHDSQLRPSDAKALSRADLVIFVGSDLVPWISQTADTLAPTATHIALLDLPATQVLMFREGVTLDIHDESEVGHEDDNHEEDEHKEDQHGDGGHEDGEHAENEAAHDVDHDDHHEEGHAHDGRDPHAWLDPENAIAWTAAIAETLAQLDPENAAQYRENATHAQADIHSAMTDAQTLLAPHSDAAFVVFHDAYQYFEHRFAIRARAAIALGDASAPGPARITHLRELIAEQGIRCVFSEPQLRSSVMDTVVEASEARLSELDPIGLMVGEGPQFYPDLIRAMTTQIATCLSAE